MSCKHWLDRRRFLAEMATGLQGIALAALLGERKALGKTHFPAKAKRVIQIFCPGGVSHIDTFEYKPALEKHNGQPLPGEEDFVSFQGKNGNLLQSPWKFRQRGESGKWVTELLPHLGELVDEMAFVHSMTAKSNTHGPACCQMNTGFVLEGFPSMGSWGELRLGGGRTKTCPRSSRFRMCAVFRRQGRRTGPPVSCRLNIRQRCSMLPNRSAIWIARTRSAPAPRRLPASSCA